MSGLLVGIPSLPPGPQINNDTESRTFRDDTAIGVVLSNIYFFINNKRKENQNPWEIIDELPQMVCNYLYI